MLYLYSMHVLFYQVCYLEQQSVQNKAGSPRSLAKALVKQFLLGTLIVQNKNIQYLTNEKCFLIVTLCQIF